MNKKAKLSLLGTLVTTSFLAVALPIVSCSSSTNTNLVTTNNMEILTQHVTELLTNKMEDAETLEDKEKLAKEWSKGKVVPKDVEVLILTNLKFKDNSGNEIEYNEAVNNVTFDTSVTIPNFGPIKGPKLKVNFKNGYTGNVIIEIDKLGNIEVSTTEDSIEIVVGFVNVSLEEKMKGAIGYESQLELASEWEVGTQIPRDVENLIKANLMFTNDEVKYDDVVESTTFASETIVNAWDRIIGPKIKINFNVDYIDDIYIETGDLGQTYPPLENLLFVNDDELINVSENLTNQFIYELNNRYEQTRRGQGKFAFLYKTGLPINNPNFEILKIIMEGLTFSNNVGDEIKGSEAIDIALITKGVQIPNPGEEIKGPTLEIKLKPQYFVQDSIIFEIGNLGVALPPSELTVEDSVLISVQDAVAESFTRKMQRVGITKAEQVELAATWLVGNEIPKEELNLIKKILVFKNMDGNEITYLDSVVDIIFQTSTLIPEHGIIDGPKLRVTFNDGYTGDILIEIGSLGIVSQL